ncbi:MAG: PAAR domain-containing protein [Deltaproteobacteria bacterium]|nr:PAAR domain-containing protein [Deltaproteobacteria bacterium]
MPPAARLGDKSRCPADAHGCVACPHSVIGPAISGSGDVFINSRPAVRVGDKGVHAACCGPNMWTAAKGSATVFINGKASHRKGDMDTHCGGIGSMVEGSADVIIGG